MIIPVLGVKSLQRRFHLPPEHRRFEVILSRGIFALIERYRLHLCLACADVNDYPAFDGKEPSTKRTECRIKVVTVNATRVRMSPAPRLPRCSTNKETGAQTPAVHRREPRKPCAAPLRPRSPNRHGGHVFRRRAIEVSVVIAPLVPRAERSVDDSWSTLSLRGVVMASTNTATGRGGRGAAPAAHRRGSSCRWLLGGRGGRCRWLSGWSWWFVARRTKQFSRSVVAPTDVDDAFTTYHLPPAKAAPSP